MIFATPEEMVVQASETNPASQTKSNIRFEDLKNDALVTEETLQVIIEHYGFKSGKVEGEGKGNGEAEGGAVLVEIDGVKSWKFPGDEEYPEPDSSENQIGIYTQDGVYLGSVNFIPGESTVHNVSFSLNLLKGQELFHDIMKDL